MSRSQTDQSWSERISDAYEDDYNDLTDQQRAHLLKIEDDERSRWESERRFADIEDEFQRIRQLGPDGMGTVVETVEDEYDRLQVLRNESIDDQYDLPSPRSRIDHRSTYNSERESRDRFPNNSGGQKDARRTARHSEDSHCIGPAGGPVSGQSTFSDPVQGLRDVLLAPQIGEPQQAYLSRMERDGGLLSAAVVRWHDMEGRWRPFVAEAKDDYIQRIAYS
ncbi:hypothetical protein LTR35_014680 [Friedmanniomyces endolithicus]|uniref:Uncharacterized protein n=1 Tax=Friedmanniomyces endolithicus TaxID=329885 RepID=A0AAN6FCE4_9PEZI|nr:hypothetical protein LTR35_014680 [Friedmanniomyces endolithicus]KAK0312369.1 hypothetical protein LTR82_014001 [Friedmanniomyces endolithicus]KAK1004844.1 hypothetical protein LTR54_007165 [Friedmanniomyces endolithicus]